MIFFLKGVQVSNKHSCVSGVSFEIRRQVHDIYFFVCAYISLKCCHAFLVLTMWQLAVEENKENLNVNSYIQIEQKISRVSLQGTVLSFLNILHLDCISVFTSMNVTKAKATKPSYIILENYLFAAHNYRNKIKQDKIKS